MLFVLLLLSMSVTRVPAHQDDSSVHGAGNVHKEQFSAQVNSKADDSEEYHAELDRAAKAGQQTGLMLRPEAHTHRAEFVFQMSAKRNCFGEEFHDEFKNFTFEYKRAWGDGPVQVQLLDHTNTSVYDVTGRSHDVVYFLTVPGHFSFCFTSQSYLSLGNVAYYMSIEPTETEHSLNALLGPGVVMNPSAVLAEAINTRLQRIRASQRVYRLSHEDGRKYADALGGRLGWYTVCATAALCLISVVQTKRIRMLFTTQPSTLQMLVQRKQQQLEPHSFDNHVIETGDQSDSRCFY